MRTLGATHSAFTTSFPNLSMAIDCITLQMVIYRFLSGKEFREKVRVVSGSGILSITAEYYTIRYSKRIKSCSK